LFSSVDMPTWQSYNDQAEVLAEFSRTPISPVYPYIVGTYV